MLGVEQKMEKQHLDVPIRYCCVNSNSNQTWREFIIESENEFGMCNENVDNLTEEELNIYVEFLNYLWDK